MRLCDQVSIGLNPLRRRVGIRRVAGIRKMEQPGSSLVLSCQKIGSPSWASGWLLSAAGRPRRFRPGVFSARFAFKSVTEVKTTTSKMKIRERGALQRYLSDMDLRADAPPVLATFFTRSKRVGLKNP